MLRLAAAVLFTVTTFAEEPFSFEKTPGRLPKDAVPRSYAIRIEPDLEAGKFSGAVDIEIETRKPLRELTLNSLGLAVTKAATNGAVAVAKTDDARQFLTVTAPAELAAGRHTLRVEFTGKLTEQPQGMYFTRYQQPDGAWHKAVVTQMEPADARRMFPCWDEPVFRATFQLTAVVPAKHTALFNMPIVRESALVDGRKEIAFGATPAMPSYLVAFVSSELESLEDSVAGVQLRNFTTPGRRDRSQYAMEATKKVLPWFNEYFGANYPLPKLDQVAFPSVAAGGMENWGAIIYAEGPFFYDPASQGQGAKERVFDIVAHEIAHQWFGDLVTMAWWDNLWLNEGFASWMATKVSDHFNPAWRKWTRALGGREAAMRLDARGTTHPIQQPVENEAQAGDAFDEITYQKGQAFLRMLESWLGEDAFRAGMRLYFKRHAMGNTTTANLWAALGETSGRDVAAMAAGWTEQPGFPVVRVAAEDGALTLTQERFSIFQKDAAPLAWQIPVVVKPFPAGDAQVHLLGKTPVKIPGAQLPWIVNSGGAGYFRVSYEGAAWEHLKLNLTRLPEVDQLCILHDTWALVLAGRTPLARWFEIAELLNDEAGPLVGSALLGPLGFLDSLQRGDERRGEFRTRAMALLKPLMQRAGWEPKPGEDPAMEGLRSGLIEMLGMWGDEKTGTGVRERLAKYLAGEPALDGPARGAILAVAGRFASAAEWDALHARAKRMTDTSHKADLYRALVQTRSAELAKKALAIALSDELPARQAARIVRDVAGAGDFPELAWKFTKDNLPALLTKLTALDANHYVPSIFRSFADEERATELEQFVAANFPASSKRGTAIVADEIRFRAQCRARLLPAQR